MYTIQVIADVINGRFQQQADNRALTHLVYDSRKIQFAESSLFFALQVGRGDGHQFLASAYQSGIRNFVVAHAIDTAALPGSNVIVVDNTLQALQQLAAYHRQHFQIPILGITGSNGKTIVKEWLYQLLQPDHYIVRSPKSYNSQVGVPLSVWQLNEHHNLGIFEAGISQPGEMERLARIIQPTIGVLTNLGQAHSEGFASMEQKLEEKLKLFQSAQVVVARQELVQKQAFTGTLFTWSFQQGATVRVKGAQKTQKQTSLAFEYGQQVFEIVIPFTDEASIENAISCCCVLLYLEVPVEIIQQRFLKLHAVDMRLHLMRGINNCTLINDSYSADLTSLHIALSFLQQQHFNQHRTVILSDFYESGKAEEALYWQIGKSLLQYGIEKVILIGEKITTYLPRFIEEKIACSCFHSTEDFVLHFRSSSFKDEVILIKGARRFEFEQVVQLLEYKVHQTLLEINLNAIVHNLKQYQKLLKPHTRVMAMVKAFAYGSGGAEIAGVLQYHNVHYLGVAYVDEGLELRKAGITLPIMVMNVDETSFGALTEHNLQPVIYSFELLHQFETYIASQALQFYPVHIEVETGMNRLGFPEGDIEALGQHLAASSLLKVESVFSHLAASEDAAQDDYTAQQAQRFSKAADTLSRYLSYSFLRHISNTAAIIRHPHLQLDMVRLGIGLYGVEITTQKLELQPAATLRTTIAQIKHLKAGETVSYNRRGVVQKDSTIATVRIGYADGYSRRFGHGVGKLWVAGHLAPVIGTVCMDMTMIDVTGIPGVKEGDTVIVFGEPLPVQQVAAWIDTIPYELMTSISQRVKRIYFQE